MKLLHKNINKQSTKVNNCNYTDLISAYDQFFSLFSTKKYVDRLPSYYDLDQAIYIYHYTSTPSLRGLCARVGQRSRPDHNTGNSMPYSSRTVCGFFNVP